MLTTSIIFMIIGLLLILVSRIVSKAESFDLRENLCTRFVLTLNRYALFNWAFC